MDINNIDQNEVYVIHAPKDWLDFSVSFPNGVKLYPDSNIESELFSVENCYFTIGFKDKSMTIDMTDGMKELLALRGLKHFLHGAFKIKTKPTGSNPRIVKRNEQIRKEYFKLHNKEGLKSTKAYELLSEKYKLSIETIKSYVK